MPSPECISSSLKLDMDVLSDCENLNWEREREKKKTIILTCNPQDTAVATLHIWLYRPAKRNTSVK